MSDATTANPSIEDDLKEAKEAFELCREAEKHNREPALDDLRFARLAEQWPTQILNDRTTQRRPCLTINRMPSFIRQVVNDIRQNKPSPNVRPVDGGADVHTAQIYTGLIRNIEQQSNAEVAYDTAAEYAITMSFGYYGIDIDYAHDDTFDKDIKIRRIANPFAVYGDPWSTAADSEDWKLAFETDLMPIEDFRKQYKGAEESDWEQTGYERLDDPWRDGESILIARQWLSEEAPEKLLKLSDGTVIRESLFLQAVAKDQPTYKDIAMAAGVTVVGERPTKTRKVKCRLMTGTEILDTTDWPGRYIPLIPIYGDDINVEGKRYLRSLIRDAKDPQRMFNYWRTAATEAVALMPKAPWIGPEGAFNGEDSARWETANTENHPYLTYPDKYAASPPQRVQPPVQAPGAIQEALQAGDDMKSIMGMYDASLGARSNETSGKAINARKIESDTGTFNFIDNVARGIKHGGKIMIDLIPRVYTPGRIIRVLGEDGKTANNVTLGPRPQGYQQPTPEQKIDFGAIYDLGAGKYDLVVDVGPGYTTKRQESADQMMQAAQAFPEFMSVAGDLLAKNLDWPGAQEIADRLRRLIAMKTPQILEDSQNGIPPQVQQMMEQGKQIIQQLQQALMQKEQELQSLKMDKSANMIEAQNDTMRAETERFTAEVDALVAAHQAANPLPQPQLNGAGQ